MGLQCIPLVWFARIGHKHSVRSPESDVQTVDL